MSEAVASPIVLSEVLASAPGPTISQPEDGLVLDDSTMNHLTYKATNKVPYVIDYFGLKDFYNSNPMVTQMAKDLHLLFVTDDTETQIGETKDILDALSQEINLQENDAPIYKLRRVLEMAQIKNRLADNEQKKLRMLADMNRM